MNLGVFGAGAIGAYLGGRLIVAGVETTLVARPSLAEAVARAGLRLTDYRGFEATLPAARVPVATDAGALASCDVILVTVKALDTAAAGRALAAVARPDAVVVSFQNGMGNVDLLRAALGERVVLAGMVPFNVARRGEAHFHQATSGRLAVEQRDGREVALVAALASAGLPAHAVADMRAVLWGKLLVNLNNPVVALSGLPLAEELGQRGYRRVFAACMREGLAVLARAGIKPHIDAPLPPSLLPAILSLPDGLFRLAARSMIAIDPTARNSMWEDLQRGRKTEIDLLNGEIIRLGAQVGVPTPHNQFIVDRIRQAEAAGAPPSLAPGELTLR
jgi:2-dehydropantoate 2-reductase